MKRYVKELAADRVRDIRGCIQYCKKNGSGELNFYDMQLERIAEILIQCEYGYISDYEACRLILEA